MGWQSDRVEERFSNSDVVVTDFFKALTEYCLGEGAFRAVYSCRANSDIVIKIEEGAHNFSNITEWNLWMDSHNHKLRDWLAPCEYISPCGVVLLMGRTTKPKPEEIPKKIPAIFTDLKVENFGMYNGKFVCHDYGNLRPLMSDIMRLRRADWWYD